MNKERWWRELGNVRYLALLEAIAILGILGTTVFMIKQRMASPNPVPTPSPEPGPVNLFEAQGTLTPSATAEIIQKAAKKAASPTKGAGEPCLYSAAWINAAATPVPDGGHSQYQQFPCVDGYWDLGFGDWINRQGKWGSDGYKEEGYIKYNKDGSVANGFFIDSQGRIIPRPTE
jgi:hypothetical protein